VIFLQEVSDSGILTDGKRKSDLIAGMKNYLKAIFLVLFVSLVLSILILASTPPVSRDALVHHLAIPKLYLKKGAIYEIPDIPFSYYPMNIDFLYIIPLYFGNDIIPKFIHFGFALLTAWLVFNYLKSRLDPWWGLLGAIFFLSLPIIVKLSITVYTDLGLIFFSTASLLLILKWLEEGFRLKLLLASAVFCGLAMGTKYNGLITLLVLTLFVPYLYSRFAGDKKGGFFPAIAQAGLFLIVALLVFSPWMVRNYCWTHNPIFPLYDHWFRGEEIQSGSSVGFLSYRTLVYGESWWQMAMLPVRIFFQGQDGNPQYFDGKLNPFLLFLPLFAFFRARQDPRIIRVEKKILLAFAGLCFLFAFFSSALRIRYIGPILPPLVILSVFGMANMVKVGRFFHSRVLRTFLIFVIFSSALWLNAKYIAHQFVQVKPLDYLTGKITREEFITRSRPEYPVMRYINTRLALDAKILFIHMGNRGYYCDREYVFDLQGTRSAFQQLVRKSPDPEKISQGIRGMGVTHLLIHWELFRRWVGSEFDSEDRKKAELFFRQHVRLEFFHGGYGLFLIL